MGEKEKLFHSQQGLCWLCDKPMTLKAATWDHLLPASKGGTWAPFNLKLAHRRCNYLRGNRDFLESREYVQAKLAQPTELHSEPKGGKWLRNYVEKKRDTKQMYDRLYALLRSEGVIR